MADAVAVPAGDQIPLTSPAVATVQSGQGASTAAPAPEPTLAPVDNLANNIVDVQRVAQNAHPETVLALASSPDPIGMSQAHNFMQMSAHAITHHYSAPSVAAPVMDFTTDPSLNIKTPTQENGSPIDVVGHILGGIGSGVVDTVKGAAGWVESSVAGIGRDVSAFVHDPIKFIEHLPAQAWGDIAHWFDQGINMIPHLYRYTVEYANKNGWDQAIGHLIGTLIPGALLGAGIGGVASGAATAVGEAAMAGAETAGAAAGAEGAVAGAAGAEGAAAAAAAAEAGAGADAGGAAAAAARVVDPATGAEIDPISGTPIDPNAPLPRPTGRNYGQEIIDRIRQKINPVDETGAIKPTVKGDLPPKYLYEEGIPHFTDSETLLESVRNPNPTDWNNLSRANQERAAAGKHDYNWAKEEIKRLTNPEAKINHLSESEKIVHEALQSGDDLVKIIQDHIEGERGGLKPNEERPPHKFGCERDATTYDGECPGCIDHMWSEVSRRHGDPIYNHKGEFNVDDIPTLKAHNESMQGPTPTPEMIQELTSHVAEDVVESESFRANRALSEHLRQLQAGHLAKFPKGETEAPGFAESIAEIREVEKLLQLSKDNIEARVNETTKRWMNIATKGLTFARYGAKPITVPLKLAGKFMTDTKALGSEITGMSGANAADHDLWKKTEDGAKWIDPFMKHHATMGQSLVGLINHYVGELPGGSALHIGGIAGSAISGGVDFASQFVMPDPFGAAGNIYKAAHTAEGVSGAIGQRLWSGIGIRSEEDVVRLDETNGLVRKTNQWIADHNQTQIMEALRSTGTSPALIKALGKAKTREEVVEVWMKAARANEIVSGAATTIGAYTRFKAGYRTYMDARNAITDAVTADGMSAGMFRRAQMRNSMRYLLAQRPWWLDSDVMHGKVNTFEVTHADANAIPAIVRMLRISGESEGTINMTTEKLTDAVLEGDTEMFKHAAMQAYLGVAESHLMARLGTHINDTEWIEIRNRMRSTLQSLMQSIGLSEPQSYTNGADAALNDAIVGADGLKSHTAGESAGHLNALRLLDPRDLKNFIRKYAVLYEGDSPAWSKIKRELDTMATNVQTVEQRIEFGVHDLTATKLADWLKNYSKVHVDPARYGEPDYAGLSAHRILTDFMAAGHGEVLSIVKMRSVIMAERDTLAKRLKSLETGALDPATHRMRNELNYQIHSNNQIISHIQMQTSPKVSSDWESYNLRMGPTGRTKKGKIIILDRESPSLRLAREEYRAELKERCANVGGSIRDWRSAGQVKLDLINNTVNNLWFKPLALFSQAWAWHVAISEAMLNVFRNGFFPTFSSHFAMQYAKNSAKYGLEHAENPVVYNMVHKAVGGLLLGFDQSMLKGMMGEEQGKRLISDAMDIVMLHPGSIHPGLSVSHGGSSAIVDHSNTGGVDLGPYKVSPAYFSGKFRRYSNEEAAIATTWQHYADKVLMDEEHNWIANAFRDKIKAETNAVQERLGTTPTGEPRGGTNKITDRMQEKMDEIEAHHQTVITRINNSFKNNPANKASAIANAQRGRDRQLEEVFSKKTSIEKLFNSHERAIAKIEKNFTLNPVSKASKIKELEEELSDRIEFEINQIGKEKLRQIKDEVTLEYRERLGAKPEVWRKQFERNSKLSKYAHDLNQHMEDESAHIDPLTDWARVSVHTNMSSWTSIDQEFHHPWLLNQIADKNIKALNEVSDYNELCKKWGRTIHMGAGMEMPDAEVANLFPSQINGPDIMVANKWRTAGTWVQRISEQGHTKVFGPFVDWMSREPTFLWEYHQQMESMRGRIANLALAEHELPFHLSATKEDMQKNLPAYAKDVQDRTLSYLAEHPNHKIVMMRQGENAPESVAEAERCKQWLEKTFFGPDGEQLGWPGDPTVSLGKQQEAIGFMHMSLQGYISGHSSIMIAYDREGNPASVISFFEPTTADAALNTADQPFLFPLRVSVTGSTQRAKNAASALQYHLAEHADNLGLPVESSYMPQSRPFHEKMGRVGASMERGTGREAYEPYMDKTLMHDIQEEPLGHEHSTASLWFRYHVADIASSRVAARMKEYEDTRALALSSYGDLTGEQARLIAQNRAAIKMIGYVHNPAEKTALEHGLRMAAPFYFAQNQAWRRAFRLMAEDPGAFERYFKANLAVSNYANSHQVNGIPMTSIPGSQAMGLGVGMLLANGALNYGLNGNLSSTHSMSLAGFGGGTIGEIFKEFLPQFGPVMNVPTKVAMGTVAWGLRKAGDKEDAQSVIDLQNMAVGNISANKPIWMDVIPSTLIKNALQGMISFGTHDAGNVFGTSYASTRNQVLIELADQMYQKIAMKLLRDGNANYTANQLREMQINPNTSANFYSLAMLEFSKQYSDVNVMHQLCNEANRNAAVLWTIKTLGSFVSPLSLSLEKTGVNFTGELTKLMQEHGATEGYAMFAKKYPNHTIDAVFMSLSPENITYPETAAAQKFFDKHGDLLAHDKYAGIMAYLIPRNKRGDAFDAQAYATELQFGLRKRNVMDNGDLASPGIAQTIAINAGNNWYYNNIQFKASCYKGIDPMQPDVQPTDARIAQLNERIGGGFGTYANGSTGAVIVDKWVKEQVDQYSIAINRVWGEYHSYNYPKAHAETQYRQLHTLFTANDFGSIYASMDQTQQNLLTSIQTLMQSYQTVVNGYTEAKKHSQPTSHIDQAWYDYLTNLANTNAELTPIVNSLFKHLPMTGTPLGTPNVAS